MYKKVDITPQFPIYALRVPITGTVVNAEMSVGDILVCLQHRAFVKEILPNGQKIDLNLSNYNKDNTSEMVQSKVETSVQEKKVVNVPVNSVKVDDDSNKSIVQPENPIQQVPIAEVDANKGIVTEKVETEQTLQVPIAEVDAIITTPEQAATKPVENKTVPEDPKKDEVKTMKEDPKYFTKNEDQKNKIQRR